MSAVARERAALLRVRVLRRDSYRCQWQVHDGDRICGKPASMIGSRPADGEIVALCLSHSRWVLHVSLGSLPEAPVDEAPESPEDRPVMVAGEWVGSRPTTRTLGFTLPSTSIEYEEDEE